MNDRIKKLGSYFKKMNIAEGIVFITVNFPNDWKINSKITEKYDVKVMNTEDNSGYYFASKIENGFTKIFDAVEETINFNEVAGIKRALFIEKIKELQDIFEEEPLEVLQSIEFKFKKKENNRGRRDKKEKNNEINSFEECQPA